MDASFDEYAPRRRSRAGARLVAFAALVVPVTLLVAILSGPPERAPAASSVRPQLQRLQASSERVAVALSRWHRGKPSIRPLRAVRAAIADERAVARWLRSERRAGRLAEDLRLDNALEADYEYLDAVGSSLPNPRSVLRFEIAARAARARAALAALPDGSGVAATIRGWQRLAAKAAT